MIKVFDAYFDSKFNQACRALPYGFRVVVASSTGPYEAPSQLVMRIAYAVFFASMAGVCALVGFLRLSGGMGVTPVRMSLYPAM